MLSHKTSIQNRDFEIQAAKRVWRPNTVTTTSNPTRRIPPPMANPLEPTTPATQPTNNRDETRTDLPLPQGNPHVPTFLLFFDCRKRCDQWSDNTIWPAGHAIAAFKKCGKPGFFEAHSCACITRLNRSKQLTLIGIFEEVPVSAGAQGESKKNIYGSGFFGEKLAFHRPK